MDAFLYESHAYLLFIGMLQLFGGVILIPFFVPVARRLNLSTFSGILSVWALFNALLLIFGCLGNYAFHVIGNGKLYVHVDHVVDFVPFIPFGELFIFHHHAGKQGGLFGSLLDLASPRAMGGNLSAGLAADWVLDVALV